MSLSLRPAAIPRCSACIRSYAFAGAFELRPAQQQARGKKKLVNTSSTVPVRLLKNVKTFGKKGAIVPVSIGRMRNEFFPRRIAEYVTSAQEKDLKVRNTSIERDFSFGLDGSSMEAPSQKDMAASILERSSMPAPKPVEVDRLSPERSTELLSILLPPRLDFYRQPIEQPPPEPAAPPPRQERQPSFGGAAADLLAARTPQSVAPEAPKLAGARAIYGSVSTHDVLVAMRAALAENDEAARVVLSEEDIKFMETAEGDTDRVKHIGEYNIEMRAKGAETAVRRVVRVVAQEV